jgi:hypothetical protein
MRQTFKHSLADYRLVCLFVCLFVCSTSSHSDNRMRPALPRTAPHRTAAAPPLQVPSPPEPKGNAMLTVSVLWQNHKYAQRT